MLWSRRFVPHRKWNLTRLVHQNTRKENRYRKFFFAIHISTSRRFNRANEKIKSVIYTLNQTNPLEANYRVRCGKPRLSLICIRGYCSLYCSHPCSPGSRQILTKPIFLRSGLLLSCFWNCPSANFTVSNITTSFQSETPYLRWNAGS